MFESLHQTYDDAADPTQGAPRLKALREELARRKLHGLLVPHADAHQNEYMPACAERLAYLTGFTGSAGFAVVLEDKAALFVDGRYTVQARQQVDALAFEPIALAATAPEAWLENHAPKHARIGYDPWLHTKAQIDRFEKAAAAADARLMPLDDNPIDAIWPNRPPAPKGAVVVHPRRFAGEDAKKKLKRIVDALACDALLVSDPHSLAWTFNIRGADVAHTPIVLGFALIPKSGRPTLFLDGEKLDEKVRKALAPLADVEEPGALEAYLQKLGVEKAKVYFDAATAPARLSQVFAYGGGVSVFGPDPIVALKAVKNAVELAGASAAHLRDGAALARFLAWFDSAAAKGGLSEIDAARALETFRREGGQLQDISFPTISAFGPHAALPHYRVTHASDVKIGKGIYLVDSGGQYLDGTTDVTRTLVVGAPSKAMRETFTRVLKGHIAIARAVFPRGTTGARIDALARLSLWRAGLDFDHGVGHGVGSYLSVHEGPQSISKRPSPALEPGMIVSNEPGYYREGAFGVRIENLIVVERRDIPGGEREMLGFNTLTLAPIERRLIDARLLDADEKTWLDAYHARVFKELSPLIDPPTRKWLKAATRKI